MRYKVKDKVIIKKDITYKVSVDEVLCNNSFILTIKKVIKDSYGMFYIMKETKNVEWYDTDIEDLKPEPIVSRFEILDL